MGYGNRPARVGGMEMEPSLGVMERVPLVQPAVFKSEPSGFRFVSFSGVLVAQNDCYASGWRFHVP